MQQAYGRDALDMEDLAERWGISYATVAKWVRTAPDRVPPIVHLGRKSLFLLDAVEAFEREQLKQGEVA